MGRAAPTPGAGLAAAAAVDRTFRSEGGVILASLIRVVRDFQVAEDALSEAVESALVRWNVDGIPANPGAWLTRAARNKAIDRCRARHVHESLDDLSELPARDSVVDNVEREREGQAIDRCLATLEEDHQRYIRFAFFEGCSYAELAERHNIALGTMKSWIRRGLARLGRCLGL